MSESELADIEEDMDVREDDSFSNSPQGSSDEEDADEEKIAEIQQLLDASPFSYDLHVQLIGLCRKLGDLDRLRLAREAMSKSFPLTPELWLDWLTDEKQLATFPEQKEKLVDLYHRAVKDYASVSVWLEYVQFSIGNIGDSWTDDGIASVRQTFEKAITAVGIHVTQGCLIWEAFREFETIFLLSLKNKNATEDKIKEQEDRIFNLFKRQLSIPLLDMDKTYKEFKELFSDRDKSEFDSVDYSYFKALHKLIKLQPYEENLFATEAPHFEQYKEYIEFEKKEGEPVRVQNVYERAIVENCLKEELWLDYVKYMDRVVKIQDMSLLVYERAVRNCPWCVQLWVRYGRTMERFEQPHKKITDVFENALNMGFTKEEDFKEIWLSYLDYLRRKTSSGEDDLKDIEDVFDRAITQMNQYFWGTESHYAITKYWIFFTAKIKKDVPSARQQWKDLIACGHKEEARVWLDYANFEKIYGDIPHYRTCLLGALSSVSDWPETFVDLLLTFEREEGTLESFEKSEKKCESELKIINEKRIKLQEASYIMKKEEKRGLRTAKRQPPQSRYFRQDHYEAPVQMDSEGFKIPPLPPHHDRHPPSPEGRLQNHSQSQPVPLQYLKRPREETETKESKKPKVETAHENHGMSVKHDPLKDDRTVFLSNLDYHTDEEKIRDFSASAGEIEEIRLVKDFKGRSKGYCYVVYKSELDAKKALEKDREKLLGRPVLVSPCQDRKSAPLPQSKLKFSTGLEKNKVFVKNIPVSYTEKELKELFKEHGALKSIRVVTYRNGHSKGIAYVEYEDEESASNAVKKMDGFTAEDKVFSCAISNPPPRRPENEFISKRKSFSSKNSRSDSKSKSSSSSPSTSSFPRAGSSLRPRGRGRTQLSLVPRAIARSSLNTPQNNAAIQNGQKPEAMDSTSAEVKPLSNSDFANMLKK